MNKVFIVLSLIFCVGWGTAWCASKYIDGVDAFIEENADGTLFATDSHGKPITGTIIVNDYDYINDSRDQEGQYKDGKREGIGKLYYYGSDQISQETSYKNGKKEGIEKAYYESGKLKREVPYKDGEIDGILKSYYENGELSGEIPFKDGLYEGVGIHYHENGELKSETPFKEGRREGIEKTTAKMAHCGMKLHLKVAIEMV